MKKRICFWTIHGTFFLFILILAGTFIIERRVQQVCGDALAMNPGNRTEAVIKMIVKEDGCTKRKSRALWALGQLGDEKALPFLRVNYAGKTDDDACTHEAQFAIRKIEEKRFNLPGFLWRWLLM